VRREGTWWRAIDALIASLFAASACLGFGVNGVGFEVWGVVCGVWCAGCEGSGVRYRV